GNWTCSSGGARAGDLSATLTGYSFIPPGGLPTNGTWEVDTGLVDNSLIPAGELHPTNGASEVDAGLVDNITGPLQDMGVTIGFFSVRAATAPQGQLVFNVGVGKGMDCAAAKPSNPL